MLQAGCLVSRGQGNPKMTALLRTGGRAVLAALLGLAATRLPAQNALYVKSGKSWLLVRDVRDNTPMAMQDGKLESQLSRQFTLQKVDEYSPVLVSIRNLAATNRDMEIMRDSTRINEVFDLRGEFESAYALDRVFMVLDLTTEEGDKGLFIQQIGRLKPRRPVPVSVMVPISRHIGEGKFELHVFSDGAEVLNSQMPATYREHMLDQMVRKRIDSVENAGPKLFICPAPEYPAGLAKTKVDGAATVRMRIGRKGEVLDPRVVGASDPAFGKSALAAARESRFVPKVQDGLPVESVVELPFKFSYVQP